MVSRGKISVFLFDMIRETSRALRNSYLTARIVRKHLTSYSIDQSLELTTRYNKVACRFTCLWVITSSLLSFWFRNCNNWFTAMIELYINKSQSMIIISKMCLISQKKKHTIVMCERCLNCMQDLCWCIQRNVIVLLCCF